MIVMFPVFCLFCFCNIILGVGTGESLKIHLGTEFTSVVKRYSEHALYATYYKR